MTYCELTSLLVLVSHQSGTRVARRGNHFGVSRFKSLSTLKNHFPFDLQADLVKSYVMRLLQGDGGLSAQLPRPVSAAMYSALLPTIWAMLNKRGENVREEELSSVLGATINHATRTVSGSAVKRLTIEFIGRLLLVSSYVRNKDHSLISHTARERGRVYWLL